MTRPPGTLYRIASVLGSRTILGICAVILAITAIYGRIQQSQFDAEARCRSDVAGQLDIEDAESQARIEEGLVAVAQGDDQALDDMIARSEAATDGYTAARQARRDAVAICSANPSFDPYKEPTP